MTRSLWAAGLSLVFMLGTVAETPPPARAQPDPKNDSIIHPLPLESLGYYAIVLPPDYNNPDKQKSAYPLCVLLHGGGSTENGPLDFLNNSLKRDGVIYLIPRAPFTDIGAFYRKMKPGYSAAPEFMHDDSPIVVNKEFRPSDLEIEKINTTWIAHCVQDAKKYYRIKEGKVTVFGHSMGAACGFLFAVDHPELVKACFLADGYYPWRLDDDAAGKILKDNHVHLVISHNEGDPDCKFEESTKLVAYLKKSGDSFETSFYPYNQHGMSEECKQNAKLFVDTWSREIKSPAP